nr:MAG TPA: hypothetical protein [Caudoviricetes sp.]
MFSYLIAVNASCSVSIDNPIQSNQAVISPCSCV